MRRSVWAVALLTALLGCQRRVEPSEHWDRGHALYQQLYVRDLDEAFLDPQMDQAVAELKQVPEASVDHKAAQELLKTIAEGRAEAQKRKAERERLFAEADKAKLVAPPPPSFGGPPVLAASPVPVQAAPEKPDAGPPELDPFGPGASIADLNRLHPGCLSASEPFRESGAEGKVLTGTAYRLAPGCRSALPGLQDQLLLVVDGRIHRRVPEAEGKVVTYPDPRRAQAAPAGAPAAPARPAGPYVPGPQGPVPVPPVPQQTAPGAEPQPVQQVFPQQPTTIEP